MTSYSRVIHVIALSERLTLLLAWKWSFSQRQWSLSCLFRMFDMWYGLRLTFLWVCSYNGLHISSSDQSITWTGRPAHLVKWSINPSDQVISLTGNALHEHDEGGLTKCNLIVCLSWYVLYVIHIPVWNSLRWGSQENPMKSSYLVAQGYANFCKMVSI